MTAKERTVISHYPELPANLWIANRKWDSLRTAFYNAGGRAGTPRRPDGVLDPAQESGGWVGVYAPDAEKAEEWRKAPPLNFFTR